MTTHGAYMAAALARSRAVFAHAMTHTAAATAVATALVGAFGEHKPQPRPTDDGEVMTRTAVAQIAAADVAAPVAGDTITDSGETWTIEAVQPLADGAAWALELTMAEATERSRQTYRIRR